MPSLTKPRELAGSHDRLIFNDAGESVRAFDVGKGVVRVQTTATAWLVPGTDRATCEIELNRRETLAFILQLATMAGVAIEIKE